jgi:hypothetical protein
MKMMHYAEKRGEDFCVTWCNDGKSFIIRNCDEFTRDVVPKFFKPTKFSSFTRKLYRWGFRQINRGLGPNDPVIFGCAYFQRNAPELMAHMRSITASAARKESLVFDPFSAAHSLQQPEEYSGSKRTLDSAFQDDTSSTLQKRLLLSKLLQQQTLMQQQSQQQSGLVFPNMNPNSALALAGMQHYPRAFASLTQQSVDHSTGGPKNAKPADAYQNYLVPSTINQGRLPQQLASLQQFMAYPSQPANTIDIVNAAIAALRNA